MREVKDSFEFVICTKGLNRVYRLNPLLARQVYLLLIANPSGGIVHAQWHRLPQIFSCDTDYGLPSLVHIHAVTEDTSQAEPLPNPACSLDQNTVLSS
jgi:hypothetical protein